MKEILNILWTNADPGVAHNMVFMYGINSKTKGWWENVNIIIWGPSAKLTAEDKSIQEKIQMAMHAGVRVEACSACANQYGVAKDLENLGITVRPMGEPLTEMIKNNEKLITI